MTFREQISILLFLAAVAANYVLAGSVLARRLLRKQRIKKWSDRIVLVLAGLGLMCMAYGYFVEPYRLTLSHVSLNSPKIPRGFGPLRIVHISDIHSDPRPRLEERLPQSIAAEHPDIIVFTGDSLNSAAALPVFKSCLSKIAAIAPTFAVKGNWDSWYWNNLPLFEGTGVQDLDGASVSTEVRGMPVWVAGVAVGNENSLDRALAGIPLHALKILLYHYPDLVKEAADRKVDLYFAGHTHGGQIALPFYGALITLSRYGKIYEAGLFRERDTWLYVNRGIGMEGGHIPRVRFWAPPEVTVIDVHPATNE